jgi:hypothetical protein
MKTKIRATAQRALRRVLQMFSLGSVMFIMEACYGAYTDYDPLSDLVDVRVVNSSGAPIKGIGVYLYSEGAPNHIGRYVGSTDRDGMLTVDSDEVMAPSEIVCTLLFLDDDGPQNGEYNSTQLEVNRNDAVTTVVMTSRN